MVCLIRLSQNLRNHVFENTKFHDKKFPTKNHEKPQDWLERLEIGDEMDSLKWYPATLDDSSQSGRSVALSVSNLNFSRETNFRFSWLNFVKYFINLHKISKEKNEEKKWKR